jgi:hypothetical protein
VSSSGGTATETSVRKARPPEAARNRVGKELVKGARLPALAASSKKRPRLCAGGEEFGVHEGTRSPCGRAEHVLTLAAGLRREQASGSAEGGARRGGPLRRRRPAAAMQAVYRGFYLALRGASIDKPRAEGRLDAASAGEATSRLLSWLHGSETAPSRVPRLEGKPPTPSASRRTSLTSTARRPSRLRRGLRA